MRARPSCKNDVGKQQQHRHTHVDTLAHVQLHSVGLGQRCVGWPAFVQASHSQHKGLTSCFTPAAFVVKCLIDIAGLTLWIRMRAMRICKRGSGGFGLDGPGTQR